MNSYLTEDFLECFRQLSHDETDRNRAAYWDGRNGLGENVANGVYFYQLQTDDALLTRKMVILK